MPVQSVSLSNKNYKFVVEMANLWNDGFSQSVNKMVDDYRTRFEARERDPILVKAGV